jgi:hypothetical protein
MSAWQATLGHPGTTLLLNRCLPSRSPQTNDACTLYALESVLTGALLQVQLATTVQVLPNPAQSVLHRHEPGISTGVCQLK